MEAVARPELRPPAGEVAATALPMHDQPPSRSASRRSCLAFPRDSRRCASRPPHPPRRMPGRRASRSGRRASTCRPCSTACSTIRPGSRPPSSRTCTSWCPTSSATPGERSRVYVAFDDDNLYFAARFCDSKPETIVAKVLSKRDVSFGEDGFSVTLDPYDQARTGYMFDVNPNGMRSEAIYTDKDRQNWDWEGIWDAAARIDGEGWTAEVAIPLKTLSFDPARDAWGVNFTRWHGVRQRAVRLDVVQPQRRTCRGPGSLTGPRRTAAGAWPRRRPGPSRRRDPQSRDGRRRRLPGAVARRVLEDHAVAHGGRDAQPGFLRHDGGHAADQPDPLRPVLPRAAGLLPAGLGHLPVRGAGGAERHPVLLAPHRARRRGRGAHARRRPQAGRPRGTAQRRRAGRAPGCRRRAGFRGPLRGSRRGERARGVERRRHRHERQSRSDASTTASSASISAT